MSAIEFQSFMTYLGAYAIYRLVTWALGHLPACGPTPVSPRVGGAPQLAPPVITSSEPAPPGEPAVERATERSRPRTSRQQHRSPRGGPKK